MARKGKKGSNREVRDSAGEEAGQASNGRTKLDGRSFLYVGGRDCQEAVSRIDTLGPSVDCVFCPIDCISHDACLRVKTGCKKFSKAFIPLRNGSKSSLERALQTMNERDNSR